MAAQDNFMAALSGMKPSFTLGLGSKWIALIFILIILVMIAVILVFYTRSYNQKVILFKEIGGSIRKVGEDRAKFIRISNAGDKIFFIRKHKKYVANPDKQAAPLEYWFFIRSDGEWINFVMKSLDDEMREAGAFYTDKDMRMSRLAIEKILRERLQKKNWLLENLPLLINIGFIVIIMVVLILLFREWSATGNVLAGVSNAVTENAKAVMNMQSACGTGGLVPVG